MTAPITQIVVGARRHGVVRFGLELHEALARHTRAAALVWAPTIAALPRRIGAQSSMVHLQFTDRLFGTTPAAAMSAFSAFAGEVTGLGAKLTVTLHDLPQPSDGESYTARVQAYQTVASLSDRVVVCSEHERDLMRENGIEHADIRVVPLPITKSAEIGAIPSDGQSLTLGVFGFVYPGKGYEDVIAGAEGLPSSVELRVLGAASPGHEALITDLQRLAARSRRPVRVTGHIDEPDLLPALRAITVPIIAHRRFSASGSLNSWLAAGRRPLAPLTRYTAEVERRNPGCLNLFPDNPAGLRAAIHDALACPASTWLTGGTALQPSPSEAAAAYAEILQAGRC